MKKRAYPVYLKKVFLLIVMVLLLWVQAVPAEAALQPPKIKAQSAIVIDAETGEILYQKDPYTLREPASVTKIMTCLLALENLELDQVITVSGHVETLGTVMNLQVGEQITVENLLYGLMLCSANDAAEVLAREVSGTTKAFAREMTARARECGARDTKYQNPNGLNWEWERDQHVTTAYDMAMITKEAMENETFRELVSTAEYTIPATNKSGARKLQNTNHSLWDDKTKLKVTSRIKTTENGKTIIKEESQTMTPKYEGMIGVKTGFTSTAGACLVGAVDRGGTELISVALFSGNKDRYSDTIAMLEYSLDKAYHTYTMAAEDLKIDKVRVKRGAKRNVIAVASKDVKATIPKETAKKNLSMEFVPEELEAPVQKGQKVGTIKIYNGTKVISQADAVAEETVEVGGILSVFGIPNWVAMALYIFIILVLLILFIIKVLQRGSSKRRERRMRKRQKQRNKARRQEQLRRQRQQKGNVNRRH